ncbi:hypothetical protein [Stutzerimonas stutzeri]|uniref:hypothetical protein n=1 Tax=Stutzerimonas stutzeri TaxID=316 RepID=UPI002109FEFC|nr:hypothetical protein [Stutzerimonas stutzeri]MCQ4258947.1 hypothetical protein [Stutzerimonas stutzeri]
MVVVIADLLGAGRTSATPELQDPRTVAITLLDVDELAPGAHLSNHGSVEIPCLNMANAIANSCLADLRVIGIAFLSQLEAIA